MSERYTEQELRSRASSKEPRQIRRQFTDFELNRLRADYTDVMLKLEDISDELDTVKSEFKLRMEPLKKEARELASKVRHRYQDTEAECYVIPNHVTNMMEYWDTKTCEMVDERRMRPEERQLSITSAGVIEQ